MLDRNLVADHIETIRQSLEDRSASAEMKHDLERLHATIERRRQLQTETDALRGERKRKSKAIGQMMRGGQREEAEAFKTEVRGIGDRLELLEHERKSLETLEHNLLHSLPNLLSSQVPVGTHEEDNLLVETWGTPPSFDFEPREHHEIAAELNLYNSERATKLAGTRFSILRGSLARMERALVSFFLDEALHKGYTEIQVPYIVNRSTMTGTGQLPKFEDDLFKLTSEVGGEDAFLIPTAEVPVTNLHADEIIDEEQLPICYAAFTPCFRAEAGSYGKDTHGLIRQHQFHKVELVKITSPEQSPEEHERLTRDARDLLEKLNLPYRVMRLCSGDISFSAHHCYDLEVWLPGQNAYREISSCSSFSDFQARRMRLRYRPVEGGKPKFCHTINGSGLAVGRTLVAIIENNQQTDGSITVPEVLRPYMGNLDRLVVDEDAIT